MLAFDSVNEATQIWIKGREFTVARLLGDRYKDDAVKYSHGSLAIFRLAPQDYHRFHSPVDGTIGEMTYISGEYYTVNVSLSPPRPYPPTDHIAATSNPYNFRCLWRECPENRPNI